MIKKNKEIKLLAVDLDGTLFNSNCKISKSNMMAIKKCILNNIKVVITTARSIETVIRLMKQLKLDCPQIAYGGSVILDRDSLLEFSVIQENYCTEVINFLQENNIAFTLGTLNGWFCLKKHSAALAIMNKIGENLITVNNLFLKKIISTGLMFTIVINQQDKIGKIISKEFNKNLRVIKGGGSFLNIMSMDSGKEIKLVKILNVLGIKTDEIMAIGDGDSDIGILKLAGIGVAMGNSCKSVRRHADFVVEDNDNNGVAQAIKKYIFKL